MDYPEYERQQELASVGDHILDYMGAIFNEWGPNNPTLASLQRRVYKDTDAGISVSFELDDGTQIRSGDLGGTDPSLVHRVRRISFSSIVEGSDRHVELQWLDLLDDQWDTPMKAVAEFNRLVDDTNDKACRIWDEEHAFRNEE